MSAISHKINQQQQTQRKEVAAHVESGGRYDLHLRSELTSACFTKGSSYGALYYNFTNYTYIYVYIYVYIYCRRKVFCIDFSVRCCTLRPKPKTKGQCTEHIKEHPQP